MRSKKRSSTLKPRAALVVVNDAAMGVALGLALALILTFIPSFGVSALIDNSAVPETTMTVFVGTFAIMFGIGAALTGFLLMMEDS